MLHSRRPPQRTQGSCAGGHKGQLLPWRLRHTRQGPAGTAWRTHPGRVGRCRCYMQLMHRVQPSATTDPARLAPLIHETAHRCARLLLPSVLTLCPALSKESWSDALLCRHLNLCNPGATTQHEELVPARACGAYARRFRLVRPACWGRGSGWS